MEQKGFVKSCSMKSQCLTAILGIFTVSDCFQIPLASRYLCNSCRGSRKRIEKLN